MGFVWARLSKLKEDRPEKAVNHNERNGHNADTTKSLDSRWLAFAGHLFFCGIDQSR
jgi:hypothetical protein